MMHLRYFPLVSVCIYLPFIIPHDLVVATPVSVGVLVNSINTFTDGIFSAVVSAILKEHVEEKIFISPVDLLKDCPDSNFRLVLIMSQNVFFNKLVFHQLSVPIVVADELMGSKFENLGHFYTHNFTRSKLLVKTICNFGKQIFQYSKILLLYSQKYENWNILIEVIKYFTNEKYKLTMAQLNWQTDINVYRKYGIQQILIFSNRSLIQNLLYKTGNIPSSIWLIYGANMYNMTVLEGISENMYFVKDGSSTSNDIDLSYIVESLMIDPQIALMNVVDFLAILKTSGLNLFIGGQTCSYQITRQNQILEFNQILNEVIADVGRFEIFDFSSRKSVANFTNKHVNYDTTEINSLLGMKKLSTKYSFNNQSIQICALEYPPYFVKKDSNLSFVIENVSGYLTNIIRHLSVELQFRPEIYQPIDGQYGVKIDNETIFSGCVGEVQNAKAMFAAGSFSFNDERDKVIDYSFPVMSDSLVIVFQIPLQKSYWWNLFLSLQKSVWALIFGSMVAISIFITLFCRYSPYSACNLHLAFSIRDEVSFEEQLWSAIGSLFLQGQDFYAYSISSRIAIASWWIFSAIIFAVYSADVTSALTINVGDKLPDSIQEIVDSDQIILYLTDGYSVNSNLKNSKDKTLQKLYAKSRPIANCQALIADPTTTNVACINDYSEMRYLKILNCSRYSVVSEVLETTFTGFLVPKFAEYKEAIDKEIQMLADTGILLKWFLNDLENRKDTCVISSEEPNPMDINNLSGVFIITVIIYSIGSVLICVEYLYLRISKYYKLK